MTAALLGHYYFLIQWKRIGRSVLVLFLFFFSVCVFGFCLV